MGLAIGLSSNSYRSHGGNSAPDVVYVERQANGTVVPVKVNPDAGKFTRVHTYAAGDYIVATVNYPDATTFGGNKVIVFEGLSLTDFYKLTQLDPHFIEGNSIVARFPGDEKGFKNAVTFVQQKIAEEWERYK